MKRTAPRIGQRLEGVGFNGREAPLVRPRQLLVQKLQHVGDRCAPEEHRAADLVHEFTRGVTALLNSRAHQS